MQIVLSGQPELARKLASPALVQLRQRISIIAHLQPFSPEQTIAFVEHRLRVAGWNSADTLFDTAALGLIAEHSKGIPRNINNLCFNSLSLGCALKRKTIDREIVCEVIADLDLDLLTGNAVVGTVARPRSELEQAPSSNRSLRAWLPRAVVASVMLFVLAGMNGQRDGAERGLANIMRQSKGLVPLMAQLRSESFPLIVAPSRSIIPHSEYEVALDHTAAAVSPITAKDAPASQIRILVPPGVTLDHICAEALKTCRSKELAAIQRSNPWLTNLDHLESGRELLIPSGRGLSAAPPGPSKPSSSKSSAEVAIQ
jgi:hypothetical protein